METAGFRGEVALPKRILDHPLWQQLQHQQHQQHQHQQNQQHQQQHQNCGFRSSSSSSSPSAEHLEREQPSASRHQPHGIEISRPRKRRPRPPYPTVGFPRTGCRESTRFVDFMGITSGHLFVVCRNPPEAGPSILMSMPAGARRSAEGNDCHGRGHLFCVTRHTRQEIARAKRDGHVPPRSISPTWWEDIEAARGARRGDRHALQRHRARAANPAKREVRGPKSSSHARQGKLGGREWCSASSDSPVPSKKEGRASKKKGRASKKERRASKKEGRASKKEGRASKKAASEKAASKKEPGGARGGGGERFGAREEQAPARPPARSSAGAGAGARGHPAGAGAPRRASSCRGRAPVRGRFARRPGGCGAGGRGRGGAGGGGGYREDGVSGILRGAAARRGRGRGGRGRGRGTRGPPAAGLGELPGEAGGAPAHDRVGAVYEYFLHLFLYEHD